MGDPGENQPFTEGGPWEMGDPLTPIRLVTQTITYSPEREAEGIYGNCLQAAVASLFDKPLDAVPHFSAFLWWNEALSLWARGEGYVTEGERTTTVPDRLCIVGGKSPRGVRHVCVAENGHLVWDPHPDRSGLLTITDATWFVEHEPYMKWTRWAATQRRDESAGVEADVAVSGSTGRREGVGVAQQPAHPSGESPPPGSPPDLGSLGARDGD